MGRHLIPDRPLDRGPSIPLAEPLGTSPLAPLLLFGSGPQYTRRKEIKRDTKMDAEYTKILVITE